MVRKYKIMNYESYKTDHLTDTEFHQLHTYNFHIKFYDRLIDSMRSEIWQGSSKEEVVFAFNEWKKSYMWLRSIRKGKPSYPEIRKKSISSV
tara:strand:+ start:270 stop:545 length:276 start_codon:yes stop_codon:yes gene_type:complete